MLSVALNGAEVRTLTNPSTGMPLHVIAARGMVFSSWRPSPEEKAALMADKPVWVIMRGEYVPEFILSVGDRNQVVPPEIIRQAQKQDAMLDTAIGKKVIARRIWKERTVEALAYFMAFCLAAMTGAAACFAWL